MMLLAAAAALSLQIEGGAMLMANPIDDQYVLYHANNGGSYGVQMTSPLVGIATRADVKRVVITTGYRWLGRQHIETDIIPDATYLSCRNGLKKCPPPMERWYTHMSTSELYATIGYKFRVHGFDVVPTVGFAAERADTDVLVTFPYEEINKYNHSMHAGAKPYFYGSAHPSLTEPLFGVDVERGHWGFGAYYQTTGQLGTYMGDPGQGFKAGLFRVTYRVGPL